MIENFKNNKFSGRRMLLSALALDTSHTFDSNSPFDWLQSSINTVNFWCGNNAILSNLTLKLFLIIRQVF